VKTCRFDRDDCAAITEASRHPVGLRARVRSAPTLAHAPMLRASGLAIA